MTTSVVSLALGCVLAWSPIVVAEAQGSLVTGSGHHIEGLLLAAGSEQRQERRQERGRSDERQSRRDCRQEEGRVGQDKRECKQEEVRDGVRGHRSDEKEEPVSTEPPR